MEENLLVELTVNVTKKIDSYHSVTWEYDGFEYEEHSNCWDNLSVLMIFGWINVSGLGCR